MWAWHFAYKAIGHSFCDKDLLWFKNEGTHFMLSIFDFATTIWNDLLTTVFP